MPIGIMGYNSLRYLVKVHGVQQEAEGESINTLVCAVSLFNPETP